MNIDSSMQATVCVICQILVRHTVRLRKRGHSVNKFQDKLAARRDVTIYILHLRSDREGTSLLIFELSQKISLLLFTWIGGRSKIST